MKEYWTIDWSPKYARPKGERRWNNGVGGWELAQAAAYFVYFVRDAGLHSYHRLRNMDTNETIPAEAFGLTQEGLE